MINKGDNYFTIFVLQSLRMKNLKILKRITISIKIEMSKGMLIHILDC